MEYKIINTSEYLLIVDDSEIKDGEWVYVFNENTIARYFYNLNSNYKKIIAHLPINSPILDGVDLLPDLEDVEQLADNMGFYDSTEDNKGNRTTKAFISGYNKAKETYKYTEEDVIKIVQKSRETGLTAEYIMSSLQQPKLPIAFESEIGVCETWLMDECYSRFQCCGQPEKQKTTTNSQCQTVWCGTYIY